MWTAVVGAVALAFVLGILYVQHLHQKAEISECERQGGILVKQGTMVEAKCLRAADIRRMT